MPDQALMYKPTPHGHRVVAPAVLSLHGIWACKLDVNARFGAMCVALARAGRSPQAKEGSSFYQLEDIFVETSLALLVLSPL